MSLLIPIGYEHDPVPLKSGQARALLRSFISLAGLLCHRRHTLVEASPEGGSSPMLKGQGSHVNVIIK